MKFNPYESPSPVGLPKPSIKHSITGRTFGIGIALVLIGMPFFYWGFFIYDRPDGGYPLWFQVTFLVSVSMIIVGAIVATVGGVIWLLMQTFGRRRMNSN